MTLLSYLNISIPSSFITQSHDPSAIGRVLMSIISVGVFYITLLAFLVVADGKRDRDLMFQYDSEFEDSDEGPDEDSDSDEGPDEGPDEDSDEGPDEDEDSDEDSDEDHTQPAIENGIVTDMKWVYRNNRWHLSVAD